MLTADRPDGFIVLGMSDEDDRVAILGKTLHFVVNFDHQRTGRVNLNQVAPPGFFADSGGNAMGAVNNDAAVGHFGNVIHEYHAPAAEIIHHVTGVNDFSW